MRILLFGKNGQVGWELHRSLQSLGQVIALDRNQADFQRPESLREIVQIEKPDIIVNAVAYTAVDKAEDELDLAKTVNSIAPSVLAEEASKINALLVHYSTDYVFDGSKEGAYLETDTTNPLNVYGETKLEGERAIQASGCMYLVFRTSWVYGSRGSNFLLTILKVAAQKENLNVVDDQLGAPTTARLIADTTLVCVSRAVADINQGRFESGLYHLTSTGNSSWYMMADFAITYARDNLHHAIVTNKVSPIPSSQYPTKAQRPLNSALNVKKIETEFGIKMPPWKDILRLTLEDLR